MKLFLLLSLVACKPLSSNEIIKEQDETVPFIVTTIYEGFSREYDEEACSLEECKDRAAYLREFSEVRMSICLQNVPEKNVRLRLRKDCNN